MKPELVSDAVEAGVANRLPAETVTRSGSRVGGAATATRAASAELLVARSARSRRDLAGRAPPTYWNIDDIQFECRIARSSAWRLVRRAAFPMPVRVGTRSVVWPRLEVVAFLDNRRGLGYKGSDLSRSIGESRVEFASRRPRRNSRGS
ncbi:MAG: helix-turn-helix transcriptional regulator [Acidimicrobiales bacterium]